MNKCKQCNAVMNPKWKECFVCGATLNVNKSKPPPNTYRLIEKMTLREFAEKNLAIKVYSELLGKHTWFVSDEQMIKEIDDSPVCYLPHEIKHLVKLRATPDEVKKIHTVKELFRGSKIVFN